LVYMNFGIMQLLGIIKEETIIDHSPMLFRKKKNGL